MPTQAQDQGGTHGAVNNAHPQTVTLFGAQNFADMFGPAVMQDDGTGAHLIGMQQDDVHTLLAESSNVLL